MNFFKKILVSLVFVSACMVSSGLASMVCSEDKKVSQAAAETKGVSIFSSRTAFAKWLSENKDFCALDESTQKEALTIIREDKVFVFGKEALRFNWDREKKGGESGSFKRDIVLRFESLEIDDAFVCNALAASVCERFRNEMDAESKQAAEQAAKTKASTLSRVEQKSSKEHAEQHQKVSQVVQDAPKKSLAIFDAQQAFVDWLSRDADFLKMDPGIRREALTTLRTYFPFDRKSLRSVWEQELQSKSWAGYLKKIITQQLASLSVDDEGIRSNLAEKMHQLFIQEMAAEKAAKLQAAEALRVEEEIRIKAQIEKSQKEVDRVHNEFNELTRKPLAQWTAGDFWTWATKMVPALKAKQPLQLKNQNIYNDYPNKFNTASEFAVYLSALLPIDSDWVTVYTAFGLLLEAQNAAAKRAVSSPKVAVSASQQEVKVASITISEIAKHIQSGQKLPFEMVQKTFHDYFMAVREHQWTQPIIDENGKQSVFQKEYVAKKAACDKKAAVNDFAYCTRLFLPNVSSKPCEIIPVGDIHGSQHVGKLFEAWRDLSYLKDNFKITGNQAYVFTGDFVDRGLFSLETICLVLALKTNNWDRVVLIRGNHEDNRWASAYGLQAELEKKYPEEWPKILGLLADVYPTLPLMALLGIGSRDDAQHTSWSIFWHGFMVPEIYDLIVQTISAYGQSVQYCMMPFEYGRNDDLLHSVTFTDVTQHALTDTFISASLFKTMTLYPVVDHFASSNLLRGGLADPLFIEGFFKRLAAQGINLDIIGRGHQHFKALAVLFKHEIYQKIVSTYPDLKKALQGIRYPVSSGMPRFTDEVDGPFNADGAIEIVKRYRALATKSSQQQSAAVQEEKAHKSQDATVSQDAKVPTEVVTTFSFADYPELLPVITISSATDLGVVDIPYFTFVKLIHQECTQSSDSKSPRCVVELHKVKGTDNHATRVCMQPTQLKQQAEDERYEKEAMEKGMAASLRDFLALQVTGESAQEEVQSNTAQTVANSSSTKYVALIPNHSSDDDNDDEANTVYASNSEVQLDMSDQKAWACEQCDSVNATDKPFCEQCGLWKTTPLHACDWVCTCCCSANSSEYARCGGCSAFNPNNDKIIAESQWQEHKQ